MTAPDSIIIPLSGVRVTVCLLGLDRSWTSCLSDSLQVCRNPLIPSKVTAGASSVMSWPGVRGNVDWDDKSGDCMDDWDVLCEMECEVEATGGGEGSLDDEDGRDDDERCDERDEGGGVLSLDVDGAGEGAGASGLDMVDEALDGGRIGER